MERRRLGNSDLEISRIGLGTWAIGGSWRWGWGPQDDAASIRTIHRAFDLGIDWIDTAPVYGLSHAEEVIGRALRESDREVRVFTKCGLVWDHRGRVSHVLERTSIEREVDASRRRLRRDVLDLCQIHWPDPDRDVEEAWEALAELRERGKVRYLGVSNFSVEHIERVRPIAEVTSLQPPYSLVFRDVEDTLLPYCREHGIGVLAYSPMASGLLTGKMSRERIRDLPDDDWRKHHKEFKEPRVSRHLKVADALRGVAARHRRSTAAAAVSWTLRHPAVTAAIAGAREPDQVDEVAGALGMEWSEDDLRRVAQEPGTST